MPTPRAERPAAGAREWDDWHATGGDEVENDVRRSEDRGTSLLSVESAMLMGTGAPRIVCIETAVLTVGYNTSPFSFKCCEHHKIQCSGCQENDCSFPMY